MRSSVRIPMFLLALVGAAACGGSGSGDAAANGEDARADADADAADAAVEPACWTRSEPDELADRSSPLDSASVVLESGTVKACYGSPRMRGRDIMGGLVPFDQPWRTGANEATSLHLPAPAAVAGVGVDAGWYSLYTIPGEESWELVVNAERERWGIPIDTDVRALDLGSGEITPEETDTPTEEMTIEFDRTSDRSTDMVIEWESTRLRIPVELQAPASTDQAPPPTE